MDELPKLDDTNVMSLLSSSPAIQATSSTTTTSQGSSSQQQQQQQQQQQRPNIQLTQEERIAKRNLKRRLKQCTRLRKYETRLQQAKDRGDTVTEERARNELEHYCQQLLVEPDGQEILSITNPRLTKERQHQFDNPFQDYCRTWIMSIYQDLILLCQQRQQQHQHAKETKLQIPKQFQTDQARQLLQNMTKGTQTESMFDNHNALLGYTRQKFIERAMLVVSSLDKLQSDPTCSNSHLDTRTRELRDRLLSIEAVLSIGCGPGCDAVGVLAYLRGIHKSKHNVLLHRLVLMDYVMPQWKTVVLEPLEQVLVPTHVPQIDMVSCDIRDTLLRSKSNQLALEQITQLYDKDKALDDANLNHPIQPSDRDSNIKDDPAFSSNLSPSIPSTISTGCDSGGRIDSASTPSKPCQNHSPMMVLVSYLLTETRGKWHAFFHDLVQMVPSGTLFYMSEPTAWQLHQFLNLFGDAFFAYYEWLDSSRTAPELQSLEGRIGPAVLLACTR